jgi:prephenate dehydratase
MAKRRSEVVSFQGERGAFSQEAIRRLLGDQAEALPCQRFEEAFQSLKKGSADAAVIPMENTLAGSVHENYDHLLHFDFQIVGETSVRIVHNLIAAPGVSFGKIRRVYSHPVAINQCLDFFARNQQVERVPFYDTAGSVKMIMEEGLKDAAGIASALAAELYGARILKKSVEDDRQNFTRFVLLRRRDWKARRPVAAPKGWKTSLVFTIRNIPGSLFRAMSVFALRDINLAKIESRPLRGKPWEYLFYLDFLEHAEEERCQKALGHLGELADFMRVLGCYPRGE